MTILLAITTAVCALKWLDYYVRAHSLAYILAKRELTPSDEEMTSAAVFVWKKILHVRRGRVER